VPFDLGGVVQKARLGFGATQGDFIAHAGSYSVVVESGGRWHLSHRAAATVETLAPGSSAARRLADGSLVIERRDHTERLRPLDEGVEQSWQFPKRPRAGLLELAVRVSGLAFSGVSATGLHFKDRKSGTGIRYGIATWIDAQGTRTRIVPRMENGRILLTVPAALVARSAFPAVLDPIISPEEGMDQPIVGTAGAFVQKAAAAFDGTNFLVIWNDTRTNGSSYELFGVRVAPDGTLLDPTGFPIGNQYDARLAFDGTQYLIVWSAYTSYPTQVICGVRVTTGGVVLDSSEAPAFCTTGGAEDHPAIASSGAGSLLVWTDRRGASADVYGARVRSDATLEDANGFPIAAGAGDELDPAVAVSGDHYLVTWDAAGDVRAARVKPDSTVLDSPPIALTGDGAGHAFPSLASDGSGALVAWQNDSGSVSAARVRADGMVLDPGGFGVGAGPFHAPRTAVAFAWGSYLVVWDDAQTSGNPSPPPQFIFGARVEANGTLLDPSPFPVSAGGNDALPALATDGTEGLAVWAHSSFYVQGTSALQAARIQAGSVLDHPPRTLSRSANAQHQADAAFDGTNYLVVWQDFRNLDGGDIYGARIQPDGTVLDPNGIAIAIGGFGARAHPRVIFDGSNYFVVWSETSTITSYPNSVRGVHVTKDGAVIESSSLVIVPYAKNVSGPSLAFDGTDYFVAWGQEDFITAEIDGAVVHLDGTAVLIGEIDRSFSGYVYSPEVAWGGGHYLVAFQDAGDIFQYRTQGTLLNPDGNLFKSQFVITTQPSGTAGDQDSPSVAFDGSHFLVVWRDSRPDGNGTSIRGARVAADGTLPDSDDLVVASPPPYAGEPRVTFDGANFLVAWQDSRLDAPAIFGARLKGDGTNLDPDGIALAPGGSEVPALAPGATGTALLVYDRFQSDPGLDNRRVHARLFSEEAQSLSKGSPCIASADCQTGHCVDGVCCESACNQACVACDQTGTCVTVTQPKRGNRPQCGGPTKCAGSCTGGPDCTFPGSEVTCSAASCSDGVAVSAAQCDGAGKCGSKTSYCSPYVCGRDACLVQCKGDSDCTSGNYCDGGSCVAKRTAGSACTGANQCASGYCVDGFCCYTPCTESCGSCGLNGHQGSCTPVMGPPVGGRPACAGSGACAGTCNGTVSSCSYPTTPCRAASCSDGIATLAAQCDGRGACPPVAMMACQPYQCGATACLGNCAIDNDCASGERCLGGVCQPKSALGVVCTGDAQCVSGYCVDGVCCESSCSGACQSCNSLGGCVLVSPAPAPGRPRCPGSGMCAGRCDGTSRDCVFPANETECAPASCTQGVEGGAAYCDGSGACGERVFVACTPYSCNGAHCHFSCQSDSDCVEGARCLDGACVLHGLGSRCDSATQCASGFCAGGVCCESACNGACQMCGSDGRCQAIACVGVGGGGCQCTLGGTGPAPGSLLMILVFLGWAWRLKRRRYT
jgi:hypothetical protein